MKRQTPFNPYLKGFLLYVGCLVLIQFAYEALPVVAMGLISAVREAVFEHMKAAFYAYLLINTIEFAVRRPQPRAFILSRLLSAVLFPWLVFLAWYVAPAVYGAMPSVLFEIIYANVALIVAIAAVIVAERDLMQVPYSAGFRVVVVVAFLVMILLFTAFSFRMPWADLFAMPTGW